ncbi:MAG: GNAT family N-acetyltransferase [Spirochaetales bacterium]|nr:GNAT family N-acetyltransferase [Spirochaetales bacterium]
MKLTDHQDLIELWESTEGLCLDEEDSYDNMKIFLDRNVGLSFVAIIDGKIIGTIKGAQDGRRGYISHIMVLPQHRGLGIAKVLYVKTLAALKAQGIWKCNLYVLNQNTKAMEFWKKNGWCELDREFSMLQMDMRKNNATG